LTFKITGENKEKTPNFQGIRLNIKELTLHVTDSNSSKDIPIVWK